MQLVIAEKPSLGRNIIEALKLKGEEFTKGDGFEKSQNYTVTWCFGHLLTLKDIESYFNEPKPKRWTMDHLPFFPENNRFKFMLKREVKDGKIQESADPGIRKQFITIGNLLKGADSVVNAGDADREGQVIVDLVLQYNKCSIPSYRLWVNDQTPESISAGFDKMKPDKNYHNIFEEGLTRTYMDWLYGINLTRFATIKTGSRSLFRVGRVIVPVVQEIASRDDEIANFKPKKYLKCVSSKEYDGIRLEFTSKNNFENDEKEKAQELCKRYNESGGTVIDVKKGRKTVNAPKLFSTSSLQAQLEDKMTASEVLDAAEELYKRKYISYPRTNIDYLFPTDIEEVKRTLKNYPECEMKNSPSIFKNPKGDKDTAHYALIPTGKKPSGLTANQQLVYDTINNRFRAVFYSKPMTVDRTNMIIQIDDEQFKLNGDIIVTEGWTEVDKTVSKKSRQLPDFKNGQHIDVDFRLKQATTTAPKHYSTSELLSFMKNPFKKEEETDVQLGTEATRAGIIENAIKAQYIEQKGKYYYILPKGKYFVDALNQLNFGIDKRQSLEFADILLKVKNNQMTKDEALNMTEDVIKNIFKSVEGKSISPYNSSHDESLGTCPICGKGSVVARKAKDGRVFYMCSNYNRDDPDSCHFFMNAKFQRFDDTISITQPKMKKLLEGKTIPCKLTSKKGSKYDANVKLVIADGRWANLVPVITEAKELGPCPVCGTPVRKRGKIWCCDNHANRKCDFVIFENMRYYNDQIKMNDKKVSALLKPNGSIKENVTAKSGKKIKADLVIKMNGKYTNLASR